MAYYIKTMDKNVFLISQEDYNNLLGKHGLVFIKSLGRTINTSIIAEIIPEEQYNLELREKRNYSLNGVLHTGEKAIRHFGQWYLDDGSMLDDPKTGHPTRPEKLLDPHYYPEVARDCVPTPQEYYKHYAQIPDRKKRLEAILNTGDYGDRQLNSGEPKTMKEIIDDSWKRIDDLHKKELPILSI